MCVCVCVLAFIGDLIDVDAIIEPIQEPIIDQAYALTTPTARCQGGGFDGAAARSGAITTGWIGHGHAVPPRSSLCQ
jgi:hypothetical protein